MKISTLNQKKTSVSIPRSELTQIIRNYLVGKRLISKYGVVTIFIGGTDRKLESLDAQIVSVVDNVTEVSLK